MANKQILTNDNIENDIKNNLKHPANLSHLQYRKSIIPLLVSSALMLAAIIIFQNYYKLVLFIYLICIGVCLAIGYFRQKNSINNISINEYTVTKESVSFVKQDTYTTGNKNHIQKTVSVYIIYFENGKSWNIPRDNYSWSKECPMSDRALYQITHGGDAFWVVSKKDTGEIAAAYHTDFFEYKK